MAKIVAIFTFLVFLNSFLWSTQASSPVVIWTLGRGEKNDFLPNLNELTSIQLADFVASKAQGGNAPIISFGLNSLSVEDLSSSFENLKSITDTSSETLFFPAVESASTSIFLLMNNSFQIVQINAGDPLPEIENPKTVLVIMETSNISIESEIQQAFAKYSQDFPTLIGMLWGRQSSWVAEVPTETKNVVLSRKKRQEDGGEEDIPPRFNFKHKDKDLLFVLSNVKLTIKPKDEDKNNSIQFIDCTPQVDKTVENRTLVKLTFDKAPVDKDPVVTTTKFEFIMNLTKDDFGFWQLSNANASLVGIYNTKPFNFPDVELGTLVPLQVPLNWSYHCSRFGPFYPKETEHFLNLKQTLTFNIELKGFQIQDFIRNETMWEKEIFADAWECIGFFSPAIWMGIVTSLLLVLIIAWGVKMLVNINTPDKFDDPKGPEMIFGSDE